MNQPEAGLPEDETATTRRIVAIVNNGIFECAGFRFSVDIFQPGDEGCRRFYLRPGV